MARRVTNNSGDWNYPQQYSARPNVHQQYGQQFTGPASHVNPTSKTAADPWNWGWEDSNGGGESSNNNAQKDPTWDWSVESVPGSYQESGITNNGPNYAQPNNVHQMWPGGYHQQFPPTFPPQIPNTHDTISDPFSSLPVVNQHSFGQGQHSLFNSLEGMNERKQQNPVGERQDMFYHNNNQSGDQNRYHSNTNQSQSYFSGFHSSESVLGTVQPPHEGLGPSIGENRVHKDKLNAPLNVGAEFRGNAIGEYVEASRDMQNRSISHTLATPDVPHHGESSSQALSPQWSTESIPSQGSDEISQTTDTSNRQSDASNTPGDVSSSQSITGGSGHESFDVSYRSDQEHVQNHRSSHIKQTGSMESDGQASYTSLPPNMPFGNEQNKDSSIPFFNPATQNFNRHSPVLTSSIQHGQCIKTSENPVEGADIFSTVEKVSSSMESLNLNSSHPDVENVEVAPPENSNPSIAPVTGSTGGPHLPVSAGTLLLPPPVSSPSVSINRKTEKGANPYAAKGSSLNHKNANKNTGKARSLVPSHIESFVDNKNSNKSIPPVGKANKVSSEGDMSQAGPSKSIVSSSNTGSAFTNSASPGRIPLAHGSEDSVNLETVPDNKERPDVDVQLDRKSASPVSNLRFHQTPVGQDASASQPPLWPQESGLPDNQEVYLDNSSVFSLDSTSRDNFPSDTDTASKSSWHRSPAINSNEVLSNPPHSELDRIVPGQGEENTQSSNIVMQQSFGSAAPNSNIEDIARRQVPGHQDTLPSVPSGSHSGSSSTVEDISARAVPGGPVAGEVLMSTGTVSSMYMHRTIPGQTSGAHQLSIPSGGDTLAAQGEDDTPPPGLSRMVPGESRGPEGQGGDDATTENAPDEPRVVTGLAEESRQTVGTSSTASSSFRPLPDEPRVVTGVAQDELDNSLGQLTSPISTSSMPSASSDGHETTDLDADGQDSPTERVQLPSERSETIGSDCVEAFPVASSDSMSRRDTDSQRRNTDDVDANSGDLNRHGSSREYFNTMNSREREGPLDHSTESRRFRDDRDTRLYDRDDHLYERDQDKSPRSRYSFNRERGRYDDQEYGQHRSYDDQSRQGRRYKHLDEDEAEKEAYTSEGEQKRGKRDRERPSSDKSWYRDQEEFGRNYYRRPREPSDSHSREFRGRERDQDRDGDRDRVRDRGDRDRERDRDVERDKERDRDRYYDRRYAHDRDYRRHDEYYGHYEDYYGQRSRPSSRSGSRPEFEDERRRDYHQYGGYYYNQRAVYDEYSYRYYMAWQRYMQQHPHYQHQSQQQVHTSAHGQSLPEDRGSVHSGRSSTHDELSRHHMDRSTDHNVSMMEETTTSTTPQRLTPAKFSTAHIKGLFSASGHFIKILPHYPLDGQSATVELHDIRHVIAPDAELTSFPGPLIKGVTHKKSLMNFCSRKINMAEHNPNILERDSMVLLWRLLLLLLRQNGMVVGTDIAELLLSGSSAVEVQKTGNLNSTLPVSSTPSVRSVSPASVSGAESESTAAKPVNSKTLSEEELANTFREYLLYGNTHEALEWAMKYGLWGHALFLASKLGSRTYANVMTRFANGLTLNDPLQTLYQLMSGRLPAAVTCCADERWGDWKPHLAMILSNSSVQPDLEHRAIITLGDTLASRGCLYAAHFCYLMAQLEFGFYNQKTSKLVLIGSSHTKPFSLFANNEAIQMTEIYIYACQLADPEFDVPQFQIYKLLYAKRLVEAGMPKEALQYVEVIARTVSSRPTLYSVDFVQQVFDLGNRLKVHDVSYTPDADGEAEELPWLLHLRSVLEDYLAGTIQPDGPSFGSTSNLSMSEGDSAHPQYPSASLQQEVGFQQFQDQLQQEHQLQFSQQQQQQQQISHQQQVSPPQQTVESENQPSYGDASQIPTDPGVMSSADPAVQYNMPSGWNSQEFQRQQNPEVRQDGETYWPQHSWDNGVSVENSNVALPQQDQQNTHMGWEFHSNNPDKRDGGTVQDEQSVGNGFGYYPSQTSNKPVERTPGEHRTPLVTNQPAHNVQSAPAAKPKSKKETVKKTAPQAPARNSWFGGLWSKLSLRPKNQMILPDDKEPKIVWNSEKQKWVNTDADDDENVGELPPPPKVPEVPVAAPHVQSSSTSNGDVKMPPSSGQNMYKMNKLRGSRANYVDVFGGVKNAAPSVPAPEIFPNVVSSQANPAPNFFVPAPVHSDDSTPVDFLTAAAEGGGGESSEATQQTYGAPLMFNPSDVNQFAVPHNSAPLPKKRYPN